MIHVRPAIYLGLLGAVSLYSGLLAIEPEVGVVELFLIFCARDILICIYLFFRCCTRALVVAAPEGGGRYGDGGGNGAVDSRGWRTIEHDVH